MFLSGFLMQEVPVLSIDHFAQTVKPECGPKHILHIYFTADPFASETLSHFPYYIASSEGIQNYAPRLVKNLIKNSGMARTNRAG